MARFVHAMSSASVPVGAGESIAVYTIDTASVGRKDGESTINLGTVNNGQQTFGPFASPEVIVIMAGSATVHYGVGASPVIRQLVGNKIQRAPVVMNGQGSIALSSIFGGVINASAGILGATGTLPAGSVIEGAGDFSVDDSFDWHVISTGLGTFTVAGSAGHTVVGSGAVGSTMSGVFRTRKTATDTFVTYRIG